MRPSPTRVHTGLATPEALSHPSGLDGPRNHVQKCGHGESTRWAHVPQLALPLAKNHTWQKPLLDPEPTSWLLSLIYFLKQGSTLIQPNNFRSWTYGQLE